jgi:hypothetical protein
LNDLAILTDYAVSTRYPGEYEDVNRIEFENALNLASLAIKYSQSIIGEKSLF